MSRPPSAWTIKIIQNGLLLRLAARHCCLSVGELPSRTGGLGLRFRTGLPHGERVIDQAAEIGVRTVQFIGGEPLIAPHFPALLRYALDVGLHVNVYSNLVRVAPPALWGLLVSPRVALSTSWYTADAAVHARITGSKTAWAATRANIAEAVRRGITVRAAIVDGIMPDQDTEAAEAELRALGVAEVRVRPVQGAGRAARDGQQGDASELCGHCGIGRAAVLPDGQFTPCVIGRWMHTGNVKETPIRQILAGQAWRDALVSLALGTLRQAG